MGLNADNLFVRGACADAIAAQLHRICSAKKIAVSSAHNEWRQVICTGEASPPETAQRLSEALGQLVVCAQIYEASGDAYFCLCEHGIVVRESSSFDSKLLKECGISSPVMLFREVIGRDGWTLHAAPSV